jgi:hypothetical protein
MAMTHPRRLMLTSAYVSIRQHTSAYVSIRQHTSAYVSIRQHTSAYAGDDASEPPDAYVSIRQHTSAYEYLVSLRVPPCEAPDDDACTRYSRYRAHAHAHASICMRSIGIRAIRMHIASQYRAHAYHPAPRMTRRLTRRHLRTHESQAPDVTGA